ncbi:MAG: hypothetical protein DRR19_20865 [Candidatus Parabeggiatoa sp. nov. 1]|nr:MAG: hypothetical protein DRR19_20865 [Gammaproteobacteria bacterium]
MQPAPERFYLNIKAIKCCGPGCKPRPAQYFVREEQVCNLLPNVSARLQQNVANEIANTK